MGGSSASRQPCHHRQGAVTRRRVPRWDDLPSRMQLLVVKEMTSWEPYKNVVADRLRLTPEQRRRFEELYTNSVKRQSRVDDMARAAATRQGTIQERQQHHRGAPGRIGSNSSGGGSGPPVVAMAMDRFVISLSSRLFPVAQHELVLTQAFLRSIGFVRRAADLGHWLGHSGRARFVIDRDTHTSCPVGTHAMPDSGMLLPQVPQPQRPGHPAQASMGPMPTITHPTPAIPMTAIPIPAGDDQQHRWDKLPPITSSVYGPPWGGPAEPTGLASEKAEPRYDTVEEIMERVHRTNRAFAVKLEASRKELARLKAKYSTKDEGRDKGEGK